MATDYKPFDLEGRPFAGKRRLYNIVPVQFRTNFLKREFDAQELHLRPGDEVVCETSKGPAIATVQGHIRREVRPLEGVHRVLRKANEQDLQQAERNEELEREAYRFALKRVNSRALPMKLVRAQYMQDASRIVFFFSAEGRIDFRDLVKDLAHRFRTRIEMHQIGVRDGARMLGGIGPCGRELCCSTFLEDFAPVSIRMAKDQGLTLNPTKVSGMCGRLMCCLVYEQQLYRRMRKRLPRSGKDVVTPMGKGRVIELDVINQRVTVLLEDMNRKTFENRDVMLFDPNAPTEAVDAKAKKRDEYLWEEPGKKSDGDGKKRRRGRRRSGKSDGKGSKRKDETQQKKTDETSKSSDEKSDAKPKSRRRRRSRRRGKGGDGQSSETKSTPAKDGAKGGKPKSEKPSDGSPKKSRRSRSSRKKNSEAKGSTEKGDKGSSDN